MRSFLDRGFRKAPLLTVYGGKLTTYRRLAEDVLARLAPFFRRSQPLDRDRRPCRAATSPTTARRR